MKLRKLVSALLVVSSLFLLSGCTTVQETGRSQLILMSASEEASLGADAFSKIKRTEKISTNPAVNARIQTIGKRIAGAVGRDLPNAQWEFVVFESDQLNAFALPGGKVGFYTGLINLAESDGEIAIVMGHEVAHVTSRHGAERQSQAMLIGIGGVALSIGTRDEKYKDYYLLAYGLGSTLGTLAYSRTHENEADAIGLEFAARAGYDPRAGASFWRKMAAREGAGRPPKWLSTHPPSAERIVNLERRAVALMPVYEQSRANLRVGGAPAAPAIPIIPVAAAPAARAVPAAPNAPVAAGGEKQELDKFLGR